jgi:hypothetical protein
VGTEKELFRFFRKKMFCLKAVGSLQENFKLQSKKSLENISFDLIFYTGQ